MDIIDLLDLGWVVVVLLKVGYSRSIRFGLGWVAEVLLKLGYCSFMSWVGIFQTLTDKSKV